MKEVRKKQNLFQNLGKVWEEKIDTNRKRDRHKRRECACVFVCMCVCTHACSICPWNWFHVYSEFQLLGRIHSRWVCSRSHGSLLHCLELDSTRDGGKLLNTVELSRCIVNETKAWTSLAWDNKIRGGSKISSCIRVVATMPNVALFSTASLTGDGWARLISKQVGIFHGISARSLMRESQQLSPWGRLHPSHKRLCRHLSIWQVKNRQAILELVTSKSSP